MPPWRPPSPVYRDERAVSPVIGVILMVAITVILAAVIGAFVLDLGQTGANTAPAASLTVETTTGPTTSTSATAAATVCPPSRRG